MTQEKTGLDRIEERFNEEFPDEMTVTILGYNGVPTHEEDERDNIKSFYRKEIEELIKELIPTIYNDQEGEWTDGYDHCVADIKANAKARGINID